MIQKGTKLQITIGFVMEPESAGLYKATKDFSMEEQVAAAIRESNLNKESSNFGYAVVVFLLRNGFIAPLQNTELHIGKLPYTDTPFMERKGVHTVNVKWRYNG